MQLLSTYNIVVTFLWELYRQKSGTDPVLSRYFDRGILKILKNKKALKQFVLRLFKSWRTDLNRRPADYKSAALPAELRQRHFI